MCDKLCPCDCLHCLNTEGFIQNENNDNVIIFTLPFPQIPAKIKKSTWHFLHFVIFVLKGLNTAFHTFLTCDLKWVKLKLLMVWLFRVSWVWHKDAKGLYFSQTIIPVNLQSSFTSPLHPALNLHNDSHTTHLTLHSSDKKPAQQVFHYPIILSPSPVRPQQTSTFLSLFSKLPLHVRLLIP